MKILFILLAILVFGLLVFIHELGHYIFARIFKVKINEFSIGMGPTLFSVTSKKTNIKYSISLLPIGGYVSMAGEDDETDEPDSFDKKPLWQRMLITVAGPVMNILLGIVIMFVLVLNTDLLGTTTVAKFLPSDLTGYTVSTEGMLQSGDKILRVDGTRVHTSSELDYELLHSGGGNISVQVERNGEKIDLELEIPTLVDSGYSYGARDFSVYAEEKNSFPVIMKHTWFRSVSTVKMIWESLIDLLSGKYGFEAISGPVGVTDAISDAAASDGGGFNVAYIAAVISMNLGIFNLLPVPALDGGRLLFQTIEAIRRKPIPKKIEGYVNTVGIVILLLFMLVVTFKDVFTLLRN